MDNEPEARARDWIAMTNSIPKNAKCNNCTIKLVTIAYQRAPWFRLLREPLRLGMRFLVYLHHIDSGEYLVRTQACYNCIRYYKTALRERSAAFRQLHRLINPVFDYFLERIVTGEELNRAKVYAREASRGSLSQAEVDEWMKGMKIDLRNIRLDRDAKVFRGYRLRR